MVHVRKTDFHRSMLILRPSSIACIGKISSIEFSRFLIPLLRSLLVVARGCLLGSLSSFRRLILPPLSRVFFWANASGYGLVGRHRPPVLFFSYLSSLFGLPPPRSLLPLPLSDLSALRCFFPFSFSPAFIIYTTSVRRIRALACTLGACNLRLFL